jgi:polysaccharide biosynthesis transport protein
MEPGRILAMLLRRSWMVALPVLLGAAALHWFAGTLPKKYTATGSVYVGSQAPVVLDIRAVAPEETRDLEQMRSVEQGMSASTLLMRVVRANGLDKDPSFAPAGGGEQALAATMAGRVSIALRRGTRIIDIAVEDTDPERARKLVESLVAEYEKWTTERQQAITLQANEGLAREEERLRERMEESGRKIQQFRETHPVPGLEGSDAGSPVRDALGTLTSQLTQATAERVRLEAEYEVYVKFDADKPEALAGIERTERGTEVLAQIRAIQQKEADFARVKERYLYKHPVYREVAKEISTLRSNLAETVKSAGQALEQRYRIAKDNETKLAAQVESARSLAVDAEGVREQFRAMSREADADRALHESVSKRLRETRLAASVPSSVLRWEDTPLTPELPSGPRKLVFAAVGGFLGLLLGMVALVTAELSDRKVRDANAAIRATGTPLLATVPAIENPGDGMVLMTDPASAGAEAFRRLRVVLAPQPGGNTGRTVLFTSARAGEGKSFCALNHATALAMQGHRTLLLDADLRSAGISRDYVSGSTESGLGGYLAGRIEAANACYATSLPNLYVLASGPMRSDAAELLAGTRFPSLLEDAFRWFDRVVIDAPPVLSVSDALSISRYADRCCLVVREGSSDRRELRRAADLIRSSSGNLVGFVWNEVPRSVRGPSHPGPVLPANRPGLSAPLPVGAASAHPPASALTIIENFA